MKTLVHERVEQARRGENPKTIRKMGSGWAVLGDVQFLRGYALLLSDPVVSSLNSLTADARALFLLDMVLLGDALLEVTGARRINYEILGNSEPALHAHVFPRYDDEPPDRQSMPVWFYDWESATAFDPGRDGPLIESIRHSLSELDS